MKFLVGEFRDMITVVVPRRKCAAVMTYLRDEASLRYDMLAEINGVDYLNYPGGRTSIWSQLRPDQHFPQQSTVAEGFLDPMLATGPKFAPRDEDTLERGDPGLKVDSVCGVWPGAEWLGREVYDMLGIIFVGHPDLRRILTWNGFGSYPLSKDYPLRGVGEREDYKIVTGEGA